MKEAIKTIKRGRFTGCIWYDENRENPRSWENVGKIISSSRYIKSECTAEYLKASRVSLPVYMLDYSGISVSTTPYNIRWDSGLIGYICVTDEDAREKVLRKDEEVPLAEVRKRAEAALQGEVETLDQYMSGEVYYFTVEDEKGVVVDSCGELYGLDYTEDVLMDSLEHLDKLDFPLFTSTEAEAEANSKLIASAPELLAALKALSATVKPIIFKAGVKRAYNEMVAIAAADKLIEKLK